MTCRWRLLTSRPARQWWYGERQLLAPIRAHFESLRHAIALQIHRRGICCCRVAFSSTVDACTAADLVSGSAVVGGWYRTCFGVHPDSFQHDLHLVNHRRGICCCRVAFSSSVGACGPANLMSGPAVVGGLSCACLVCILAAFNMMCIWNHRRGFACSTGGLCKQTAVFRV